jgi:hypothetical protein
MLEPVAGLTVLDDKPLLVGGFPKGLSQLIGRHTLLCHISLPFVGSFLGEIESEETYVVTNIHIAGRCQKVWNEASVKGHSLYSL